MRGAAGSQHVRIHVVVPVHEAARWHDACLASLRSQRHTDWRAAVVVDPGGDETLEIARRHAADEPRLSVVEAPFRRGPLRNRRAGWQHLDPPRDGVIVVLDGDDRWAHDDALGTLARTFADPDVWLSYGSHAAFFGRGRRAERRFAGRRPLRRARADTAPYPAEALASGAIRRLGWRAGHPLAFRRFLVDSVREEDLRDAHGRVLTSATDAAIVYPMLEMAGPRHVRHLDEVLYVYNKANAGRLVDLVPGRQRRNLHRIERRAPYAPLDDPPAPSDA